MSNKTKPTRRVSKQPKPQAIALGIRPEEGK